MPIANNKDAATELGEIYRPVMGKIAARIEEFRRLWLHGTEEDIFIELVFCLLTPQSKAKSCWKAVERLCDENILADGCGEKIVKTLAGVRFHNIKAANIERARKFFIKNGKFDIKNSLMQFNSSLNAREWLVQNVKGMGYKEASHFLRNIGLGESLAILDRHIMRNLKRFHVLDEIPKCLTAKKYLAIEGKMRHFADDMEIPMSHLDLLLWYKETGEIFK